MNTRKAFMPRALISMSYYLSSFLVGYLIEAANRDSPCRVAYGSLSFLWAALYFSGFMRLDVKYVWYLSGLGLGIGAYAAIRLASYGLDLYVVLVPVLRCLFYISPFLLNLALTSLKTRILKKKPA